MISLPAERVAGKSIIVDALFSIRTYLHQTIFVHLIITTLLQNSKIS